MYVYFFLKILPLDSLEASIRYSLRSKLFLESSHLYYLPSPILHYLTLYFGWETFGILFESYVNQVNAQS